MEKIISLTFICVMSLLVNAQSYVDLGLPSGTKWSSENEKIGLVTSDVAMSKFYKNLPTRSQWQELLDECTWKWSNKGYVVTGPNGKSIILPAAGTIDPADKSVVMELGESGAYWSKTPYMEDQEVVEDYMWALDFSSSEVFMFNNYGLWGCSVRLVK